MPIDYKNLSKLPQDAINKIKLMRWKARTDLAFLCKEFLGYPDVSEEIHGSMIKSLQQFPFPNAEQFANNDRIVNGIWQYKPIKKMMDLEGKRRRLILDFRGSLKTTINSQAHVIQWLLNYPDMAIFIIQSNGEKSESIVGEIKRHFQAGPKFRELFPEYCPQKRIYDWGTKGQFTVEARGKAITRKEPSVMAGSIDKGSAGYHFDLMKFSDIVEPNNITGDGINQVKKSFYMMGNLLVAPGYWIDVEGTRYDFSDLYGEIIDRQLAKHPDDRDYGIYVRAVFKKKTPNGEPQKFTPEELDLPELLDESGNPISWWPDRFPLKLLNDMKAQDRATFATQQLQNPIGNDPDLVPFPVTNKYPTWILRKDFEKVPIAYREICIDTAETVGLRSDHSAIVCSAWSHNGKCYIEKIVHGKFLPENLIRKIMELVKDPKLTQLRSVKIEETGFVRGLMPGLRRELDLAKTHVPFEMIKRDNQTSKKERILNTLQPWYKNQDIIFLDDLDAKDQLIRELQRFPAYNQDDILDAIADLFQNKTWFGRETERKTFKQSQNELEYLRIMEPDLYKGRISSSTGIHDWYSSTGGL